MPQMVDNLNIHHVSKIRFEPEEHRGTAWIKMQVTDCYGQEFDVALFPADPGRVDHIDVTYDERLEFQAEPVDADGQNESW